MWVPTGFPLTWKLKASLITEPVSSTVQLPVELSFDRPVLTGSQPVFPVGRLSSSSFSGLRKRRLPAPNKLFRSTSSPEFEWLGRHLRSMLFF